MENAPFASDRAILVLPLSPTLAPDKGIAGQSVFHRSTYNFFLYR
jgi:hypothetical protein